MKVMSYNNLGLPDCVKEIEIPKPPEPPVKGNGVYAFQNLAEQISIVDEWTNRTFTTESDNDSPVSNDGGGKFTALRDTRIAVTLTKEVRFFENIEPTITMVYSLISLANNEGVVTTALYKASRSRTLIGSDYEDPFSDSSSTTVFLDMKEGEFFKVQDNTYLHASIGTDTTATGTDKSTVLIFEI